MGRMRLRPGSCCHQLRHPSRDDRWTRLQSDGRIRRWTWASRDCGRLCRLALHLASRVHGCQTRQVDAWLDRADDAAFTVGDDHRLACPGADNATRSCPNAPHLWPRPAASLPLTLVCDRWSQGPGVARQETDRMLRITPPCPQNRPLNGGSAPVRPRRPRSC